VTGAKTPKVEARRLDRARPSQAIGRIPDPFPELEAAPIDEPARVAALPVLGGLQHDYRAAAW
jgi:hypothetical protein